MSSTGLKPWSLRLNSRVVVKCDQPFVHMGGVSSGLHKVLNISDVGVFGERVCKVPVGEHVPDVEHLIVLVRLSQCFDIDEESFLL